MKPDPDSDKLVPMIDPIGTITDAEDGALPPPESCAPASAGDNQDNMSNMASAWLLGAFSITDCLKGWRGGKHPNPRARADNKTIT